jgi:small nuclear ribonucleoprotein (snRNP)-like protein
MTGEKMIKRTLASILITLMLMTNVSGALAQGTTRQSSITAWENVKAISPGTKLEVALRSGETLKGELVDASDLMLTLSRNEKSINIERKNVFRVYRQGKRSIKRNVLIGAGVGGGAGVGAGIAIFSGGDFNYSVMPALGFVGAGIGAGVGALLGTRRSRPTLIYEAP